MSNCNIIYRKCGKRLFDIVVSLIALIVLSPILLGALLLLVVINKGKVFFLQERPGVEGKPFIICKLKTMTDAVGEDGKLLPDQQRITRLGRLIRSCSVDELFQLFNVLRGDMSLVGPRPLLMEYLPYYSPYQWRRHEVRPGITGLAQVKGRNALTWEKRFRYDVFYIDHLSFAFDLLIIYWTAREILRPEGIDFPEELGRFRGSAPKGKSRDKNG